jgi:mannose-1-phosphate guanylyltransferase
MFAIIMAGGSGTRFWPASRAHYPKQFLKITSERSMLEETIARAEHFAPPDRIGVIVGSVHAELTRQLIGAQASQSFRRTLRTQHSGLHRPGGSARQTCCWAFCWAGRANHHFACRPFYCGCRSFAATIRAAAETARNGSIVTLGIQPTRPETGYGYIHTGAAAGSANSLPYFQVQRFVEKPNAELALSYLASGAYLWNSGIFVFTARTDSARDRSLYARALRRSARNRIGARHACL